MSKLLHGNFSRLFRSKLYWLGMFLIFGLAVFAVCSRYIDVTRYENYAYPTADGLWFVGGLYIALVLSIFIGIWIGTEYSDGTIRNKLIAGHTRSAIYFSNLITCTAASVMMHIVYIAVIAGFGSLLLEPFETSFMILVTTTLISLGAVISTAAILTMLAMLIHSKSAGVTVSMLVALMMLFSSLTIDSQLSAPEYIETNFEMSVDGELIPGDPIPNPRFLTGTKREIYQNVLNLIPTGQMMRLVSMEYSEDMACLPLYSLAVWSLSTGIGLVLFRKKDIR